jgi:DNA-cytosine methyltransferase
MKYLSVCSGIEAATVAWHEMGWSPVAFSEIEKFPSDVLAHHYPNVPNLGDMNNYKDWTLNEPIDILVGGTPCQSFSVAGLRKGLEDPRGNLMLTFGAIADKFKPAWIVWENVPGVLSSNKGQDFTCFLDMLEELGYICDIELLDAQFFGVPQRRKRIFVCGQHRDDLLKTMTSSSQLTILQCLQEILHGILIETSNQSEKELQKLGLQNLSNDGVLRRMKLFGLIGDQNNWHKFQACLTDTYLKYQHELKNLDVVRGEQEKEHTQEDLFQDLKTENPFMYTEESLKIVLDEVYEVMKSFITLTETNSITTLQIYTCSKVVLLIGQLIPHLNRLCPSYWNAKSSSLITLQGYINYAKQPSNKLSQSMDGIQSWDDFIAEAESANTIIRSIGDESIAAEILFERESFSRDNPPCRKTWEAPTNFTSTSFGGYSQGTGTLRASGGDLGGGSETLVSTSRMVAFGEYSEDGTASTMKARDYKDATDLITVYETHPADSRVKEMGDTCQTVTSRWGTGGGNVPIAVKNIAHVFKVRGGCEGGGKGYLGQDEQTYTISTMQDQQVFADMRVRRLTPIESERLQGFPDGYSDIMPKGKPTSDSSRYKALGNSMAVPVMKWIGSRINEVNKDK